MSMTPQPGWYPDPSEPATERWWDGAAWTDHRRPAALMPPQAPTVPMGFGPPAPAPGRGQGRGKAIALTVSALVVVAAVVVGAVVLGGGDGATPADPGNGSTASPPAGAGPTPTPTDSPPSSPSGADASVAVDELDGITLPVLDGWAKAEYVVDDTILLTTPGTYDCPGDGNLCRHGRVGSSTVTSTDETSPKAVARKDVGDAADHFYDRDGTGSRPYDGLTSHQQIKEGSVTVAGRPGYMVRWRVRTASGPGGYVESLVFPASTGPQSLVSVRFAFDAGPDGPPLADMDRITKGIRPVGGAATGGGVGSSVGPSR
ncbi:DUF2510 domain-containing protein [Streptomyces sp. TS71-3]|uniref:DUF2510 domain-containing protein n=1 Tax=Streptomyces sp. TS71-3 TaxID=2733862 RepID=UPI001B21BF6D|nr:DUF2510 domain-containing protein [Streptomyces sp. TS71-3]GHJ38787.1 membrane protein [Streptomyces sp. TS71-3]